MSAADGPPNDVTPLGALYLRVTAGQERCRECRSAPAVRVHPWFAAGTSDARDPAHTHRALCADCSAKVARAQQRFAARTALVAEWRSSAPKAR